MGKVRQMENGDGERHITILIDHNMEGQAILLWETLAKAGWTALFRMEFIMFADVGLSPASNDREVWRFAQKRRMILLTNNRSDNEKDSLEQTIREENTPTSLPVLTIGSLNRMKENCYREKCAERIIEVVLYLNNYAGTSRIFIP